MPTGTTILLPVAHQEQRTALSANDSYFAIALYNVQAYLTTPWLSQPAYLICSTEVSSTFLPNHTTQSLHKVETVRRNTPCQLGISVDLTDWMPVVPDKKISLSIKLSAVRDNPFGKLTTKIGELGLSSLLSLVTPQIGEGVKIAGIVGQILSTVIEEGKEEQLLTLTVDLSVADLRAGYWAALAPTTPDDLPTALRLRPNGTLDDPRAPFSERNSYAVLNVRAQERRGSEAVRATAWWRTLQEGLRQVRRLAPPATEKDRRKANGIWLDALEQAERLAEEDRSFLLSEIRQVFQVHTQTVQTLLHPATAPEATGDTDLPEDLQRILGVRDTTALDEAVVAYQQALARSAAHNDFG